MDVVKLEILTARPVR